MRLLLVSYNNFLLLLILIGGWREETEHMVTFCQSRAPHNQEGNGSRAYVSSAKVSNPEKFQIFEFSNPHFKILSHKKFQILTIFKFPNPQKFQISKSTQVSNTQKFQIQSNPNQTNPIQSKPIQTKPNQTDPIKSKPNQSKTKQTKPI
jgi:hypothetical protein